MSVSAEGAEQVGASTVGLRVDGLSKAFGGTRALHDASFAVERGQIHALVGGNGSGKSTLIKILAGVCRPDAGEVEVNGRRVAAAEVTPEWAHGAGLGFVHQDLGLFEDLTVAENLFSGLPYPRRGGRIDWAALYGAADRVLDELDVGVQASRTVADLRASTRTLIAVARALRGREDLHAGALILDEPTARLATAEVERLLEALRGYAARGQSIVYVSHRLDEVLAFASEVTVLRDGEVAARRSAASLTPRELARLVAGREVAAAPPARRAAAEEDGARPAVLEVRGLDCGVVAGCDLDVRAGEVVGLAGLVGAGRSTLLRALFGAERRERGTVRVGGRALRRGDTADAVGAGVGFVPEDRAGQGAFLELGVRENLLASQLPAYRRLWLRRGREDDATAAAIRDFGVRCPGPEAELSRLSGGNQQKIVIARWLTAGTRLLLLDEPTQGVDVGARADIYALIRAAAERGMAVLVASADADELLELCDRVVVLERGRIGAQATAGELSHEWLLSNVYGESLAEERNA
ncbi:sugar ABC transporter ATP-binding protein [Conexibacter arvalis]|uniref:Ribose transport system ATP-binding protein n=1 Tax=Conexibacter arvalis TaxID=912552 RepID=A0A840I8M3_9ACTN|nr:sugar ABC transporter ATP-binding protein [Conexibacter arvalis]MBB4660621.1 ribose transport system ATP-binding protein [Conexibacter arvalis]